MDDRVPHRKVDEIRDALVNYLVSALSTENAAPGLGRAEAFLIVQAIERFIVAKMNDR
jgi:hypothetical protein